MGLGKVWQKQYVCGIDIFSYLTYVHFLKFHAGRYIDDFVNKTCLAISLQLLLHHVSDLCLNHILFLFEFHFLSGTRFLFYRSGLQSLYNFLRSNYKLHHHGIPTNSLHVFALIQTLVLLTIANWRKLKIRLYLFSLHLIFRLFSASATILRLIHFRNMGVLSNTHT